MRGYRGFNRNYCLYRHNGRRADLPMRRDHHTIEARIRPWRRGAWSGGIVGWGHYGRRSGVNAFRVAGRDGIFSYYWANDLWVRPNYMRRRGRRLHDGRYHHVAITFDGWYRRIYVDFRHMLAQRTSGPVQLRYKNNFCVGKTFRNEYFRGAMGDLRIYKWARSVRQMRSRRC
jgi:hypothetical protein